MATKQEKAAFTSSVEKTVADFSKSLKEAQKTVTMAEKRGTPAQIKQAKDLVNQLNSLKPMIETLQRAKSPTGTYQGPITQAAADEMNRARAEGTYGGAGYQPEIVYSREASKKGFEKNASDSYYTSTGGTGTSNTGKNYINGKVASTGEWQKFLESGGTPDDEVVGGGDLLGGGDMLGGGADLGGGGADLGGGNLIGGTGVSRASFDSAWMILRAKLIASGLPQKTVDDSVEFFRTVVKDAKFAGSPTEIEDVVDQFLYTKEYKPTSGAAVQSPYYRDFGIYNEKLTEKLLPKNLVPTVMGYKQVAAKYNLDPKFSTEGQDGAIQKYLINRVSVSELDERANMARLKSLNADPKYVETLQTLNYITDSTQLTDFFLDPNIGAESMETRRKTATFATEAVRRANLRTGISLNAAFATQQAAKLAAAGYSEAQIEQAAATGYENIAEQLRPTEKLSGIYESRIGTAAQAATIQSELEAEQFLGTASERRKRLAAQEIAAYRGQSGLTSTSLTQSTLGAFQNPDTDRSAPCGVQDREYEPM